MSPPDTLARLLAVGLVLAVLLNGAGFYLKRIGVLDPAIYTSYLAEYCEPDRGERWVGNHCSPWRLLSVEPPDFSEFNLRPLYATPAAQGLLKLAKYAYLAAFALLSLGLMLAGRVRPPPLSGLWPASPLALALGTGVALAQFGPWLALAGLRSFAFLPVALLGAWLARGERVDLMARAIALLLAIQCLLVLIEVRYGLPLFKATQITETWRLPSRMAGSMVMPNSLGVFAALGLAFYYAFSPGRRYFGWLAAAALALVLLSRSATGLGGLFALLAWLSLAETPGDRRRRVTLGLTALLVGLVLALPYLLARDDLLDSIFGRLDKLVGLATSAGALENLFGRGLGSGTNAAIGLAGSAPGAIPGAWGPSGPWLQSADSTPIALFAQIGLLGVLALYGLIGYGMVRDPAARPFYLVWALTSLMQSSTELFPADFLLGLVLARSLGGSAPVLPDPRQGTVGVEQGQEPAAARTVALEHIGGGGEQGLPQQGQA